MFASIVVQICLPVSLARRSMNVLSGTGVYLRRLVRPNGHASLPSSEFARPKRNRPVSKFIEEWYHEQRYGNSESCTNISRHLIASRPSNGHPMRARQRRPRQSWASSSLPRLHHHLQNFRPVCYSPSARCLERAFTA